jgi:hypothetical protein
VIVENEELLPLNVDGTEPFDPYWPDPPDPTTTV